MPSSVSSSGTQPQHRSHVSKLSQSHHPDMSRSATPLPNGTGKPNGHRDASTPSSMPRKPSDQLQQLANRLSLLNDILQPLPPTLPPSPPLSPKRLKRKSLEDDDVPPTSLGAAAAESGVKRARLSAEASPPTHSRHPSSTQTSDPRAASPNSGSASSSSRSTSAVKREEGELEESPSVSRVASFSSRANGITRQPRPRKTIDASTFSKMSEHFQNTAKLFKRSATKRRSPNGNASHAMEFIACLEDTDSVLHFAYSFWAMGQQRGSTSQLAKTWESIQDYIIFVHRGWEKLLSVTQDSERKARIRMITGLLALIRYSAYFQVHKLHFYRLKASNENVTASSPSHRNSASPPGFQPTPPYTSTPMPPPTQNAAPSPASSSPPGGQPNNHRGQPMVGQSPQHLGHSGPTVSVPVDMLTMQSKLLHAQTEMTSAQGRYSAELTLFNISRLFPKAYEVCIGNAPNSWTPLVPGRKEDWPLVDVEACGRGEGDWAWPPVSGDDVPHAVGFGRSILREFGDCYGGGYKGLEGTLK